MAYGTEWPVRNMTQHSNTGQLDLTTVDTHSKVSTQISLIPSVTTKKTYGGTSYGGAANYPLLGGYNMKD